MGRPLDLTLQEADLDAMRRNRLVWIEGRQIIIGHHEDRLLALERVHPLLTELGFHVFVQFTDAERLQDIGDARRRTDPRRISLSDVELSLNHPPGKTTVEIAELAYHCEPWTELAKAAAFRKTSIALKRLMAGKRASRFYRFDGEEMWGPFGWAPQGADPSREEQITPAMIKAGGAACGGDRDLARKVYLAMRTAAP